MKLIIIGRIKTTIILKANDNGKATQTEIVNLLSSVHIGSMQSRTVFQQTSSQCSEHPVIVYVLQELENFPSISELAKLSFGWTNSINLIVSDCNVIVFLVTNTKHSINQTTETGSLQHGVTEATDIVELQSFFSLITINM